jgi:hypothetical protein
MMTDLQWLFLKNLGELIVEIDQRGFTATGGELYRTPEQQQIYFDSGKSKTMDSMHLKRLAQDLNIFKDGVLINDPETLLPLGKYWMALDSRNRWGGDWNKNGDVKDDNWHDTPHFEMHI